jgi:hypothetical protein
MAIAYYSGLYCNSRKTNLFATEIHFLGHKISSRGIEADERKADRILCCLVASNNYGGQKIVKVNWGFRRQNDILNYELDYSGSPGLQGKPSYKSVIGGLVSQFLTPLLTSETRTST